MILGNFQLSIVSHIPKQTDKWFLFRTQGFLDSKYTNSTSFMMPAGCFNSSASSSATFTVEAS